MRSITIWRNRCIGRDKKPEALPYYERLLREFEKSEFLELAQKRVAELKGGTTVGGSRPLSSKLKS